MRRSRRRKVEAEASPLGKVIGGVALVALAGVVIAFVLSALLRGSGDETEESIVLKDVRVQVLNGCGVRGAGREIANRLRLKGYDVADVGNARTFDFAESVVIDRVGGGRAREIASALGVENVIIQRIEGSRYDATMIIGKDFKLRAGGP
jgi:hypothetical protein